MQAQKLPLNGGFGQQLVNAKISQSITILKFIVGLSKIWNLMVQQLIQAS